MQVFTCRKGKNLFMPPEPAGHLWPLSTSVQPAQAESSFSVFSIILLIILILVNAFFAASEIAVITLNDNKVRKMAEEGDKRAKRVLKLTKDSSRFLATIQVGVTLAGFLTSAAASQTFAGKLADALSFIPISHDILFGVSTVLVTLLLSYFSLIFGELVPKKIAMQRAESLSFKFSGILNAVSSIFHPFISFLTASTNFVLKLMGYDPNKDEQTVTEEEILMMVDQGEETGVIGESAKDMISNIFDFSDATIDEAMTHRTDITAVEDTATIQDVVNLSLEDGFSRIPVYHEDLDNIIGIIYVKDLLKYVGKQTDDHIPLTSLMRSVYFVPETKQCSQLLTEMIERKLQIAIIVDEYGGTEGIITMEDLMESIVGNIQDEYDHEEEDIYQVDENKFTVDGTTPIDEISDLVGVELPEGEYDTIAGLMVENLGRIPKPEEHPSIDIDCLTLTVLAVDDRRIAKILIEKHVPPKAEEEEAS